jgi:tetratricopeptide (TPR) repeat protein
MRKLLAWFLLATFPLLSACASFKVESEIQSGRSALRYGDPKVALTHFQRAVDLDPDYSTDFTLLEEGVWTYVGRSYYDMGDLGDARQALERARERDDRDKMAELYLGLVLVRTGDHDRGLKELEGGFKGLGNWLEYVDQNVSRGYFWDPGGTIRSQIRQDLKMISSKDVNWNELVASGERLGQQVEERVNQVKTREIRESGRNRGRFRKD